MWRRVRKIGILGGMGPAATVDFLTKIVAATPAHCDQSTSPLARQQQCQIITTS
jgi:aspartate racemase